MCIRFSSPLTGRLNMHKPVLSRSFLRPTQIVPTSPRCKASLQTHRYSSDWSHLQTELPSRRLPLVYDYLIPTPSHLLNIVLADLLSRSSFSSAYTSPSLSPTNPRGLPTLNSPSPLPPTHHIIYFPPPIPGILLLPDGTDPLQSPGLPFVRRMWAGGAVRFNLSNPLPLNGGRAACLETIRDVSVKGASGNEKVFVGIERRIGLCNEDENESSIRSRLFRTHEDDFGEAGVIERRNIVFMRERSREQAIKDMELSKIKMLKPPEGERNFEVMVGTDARLLFRYSALTYNAHAIHLDPGYCKEVEGHRGLLVHGPLSFTLMMTALRRYLRERAELGGNGETRFAGKGEVGGGGEEEGIVSVEYRNLSPLYCEEPLRICGKEKENGKWEVWAETPEGGIAVKGTVRTEAGERVNYGDLAMMGF